MRKIVLTVILILFFAHLGKVYSANNQIDTCLVGTWSGSETDEQIKGVQINWIQYRYPDGKLVTKFTSTVSGEVSVSSETGKWWTKDGKFFEKTEHAKKPDIYKYEVVDRNHIIFRSIKLATESESKNYQFVDTRVEDDKTTGF